MSTIVLYPKLESIRIEKGLTRQDLADVLEISLDSFNKRMQGYTRFSPAEEMVLSDFLDVPRAELFRKRDEGKT